MIEVSKVKMVWSEGRPVEENGKEFDNITDFEKFVGLFIAPNAPDDGAYDKTKFLIYWEDDETYEGRWDVQKDHTFKSHGHVEKQIKSFMKWYADQGPKNTATSKKFFNDRSFA